MPKTPRPWIVTRHKPIQQLDDNLWSVHAELPGLSASSDFERVMHIIRLSDGRLAFHNAIPLEAEAMREVAALGKPSILIIPMHLHAIDAHAPAAPVSTRSCSG
ncbi:MAG TPA: hypothetical protein VFE90_00385 [Myxococcales bacterium]|nr:hypothetical protein [Myxococcales bacterium]